MSVSRSLEKKRWDEDGCCHGRRPRWCSAMDRSVQYREIVLGGRSGLSTIMDLSPRVSRKAK